jgi:hypothetical protein
MPRSWHDEFEQPQSALVAADLGHPPIVGGAVL